VREKHAGQRRKRYDFFREAPLDGGARHAVHHARIGTLRQRDAACGLNFAEPGDTVFAHAGHDHRERRLAEFARHRAK
jgi:hypothetical protein